MRRSKYTILYLDSLKILISNKNGYICTEVCELFGNLLHLKQIRILTTLVQT